MKTERPRRSAVKGTYQTRSGKTIKLQQNMSARRKASKEAAAKRKAEFLSAMPAEGWKRILYRLNPKRAAKYWFSREGGIMALKVLGIAFVVGFLLLVGVFAYFRKDLPKIKDISGNNFGGSVTYYDKTGKTVLFEDYNERKRVPVPGEEISKHMKNATIAIEDKNFYEHGAFDVKGITRAVVNDIKGGPRQGGSTITQQLVKINEGWTNDVTIARKIKELILAVELEREYEKSDILTGYLNMAPYGNVNYGVETAARDYFGVSAKDLTIEQAAFLASIPKAPGSFSPYSDPRFNAALTENYFDEEGLLHRQRYVIDQMVGERYITKEEAENAKKVDIMAQIKPLKNRYDGIKAPYFVLAAKNELRRTFPSAVVNRGGWRVTTSIDLNLQNQAEKAFSDNAWRLDAQKANNAAMVVEDNETGQIVALIGGRDFENQKLNFATDTNISPGSSIKPYGYAAFIDNNTNVGAGSVLYDRQGALPGYPCTNKNLPENNGNCLFDFDRRYPGPMTIRYALGGSRNVPAVKAFLSAVSNDTSANRTASINQSMKVINGLMNGRDGYRCFKRGTDVTMASKADETQCYSSAGIGDGAYLHLDEHVNGIASLARMGQAIPHTYILKVTNSSGKVLKEYQQPKAKQVIKPDSAYIVNDMASDPAATYLSGSCNDNNCTGMKLHRINGWKNAVKTGTTNDLLDGLMVSWNKKYSAGIWVGNYTRTVPFSGQPENMTDPIMKQFMTAALSGIPADNWKTPDGLKTEQAFINRISTGRGQIIPSTQKDIFPSWYNSRPGGNTSQVIDRVSNKVATSCTPELAKQGALNSNAASWNVDVFAGGSAGSSAPQVGKDDIHNCNDAKPTISVTAVNGTGTNSGSPVDCPATGCKIVVYVQQGTHALSAAERPQFPGTLTLSQGSNQLQSVPVNQNGSYEITYNPSGSSGAVSLTVAVTDSVLYQGTDTVTVNVEAARSNRNSNNNEDSTTTSGGVQTRPGMRPGTNN